MDGFFSLQRFFERPNANNYAGMIDFGLLAAALVALIVVVVLFTVRHKDA